MFNIAVLNALKDKCIQVKQVGSGYEATEYDVLLDDFEFGYVGMDYNLITGFTSHVDPLPSLIPIVISSVTGVLAGYDDGANQYTANELTDITVTGTLAIDDQLFRVPFRRVDTGRVQLMPADVINGEFTLTLNFKTGGVWVVDNEQVNSAYSQPVFSIETQTFMVI
jgi:hypothetical protein